MTLRKTTVRGFDGTLYIIPNSQITNVANQSRDYSVSTLNVSVDFSANPDKVIPLLKQIAQEVRNEPAFRDIFTGDPQVFGVDSIKGTEVVYPIQIRTQPRKQFEAMREMQRRIRLALEEHHILPGSPYRVLSGSGQTATREAEEAKAPDPTMAKPNEINPFTGGRGERNCVLTILTTIDGCPTSRSFFARWGIHTALNRKLLKPDREKNVKVRCIPHLAKNERDVGRTRRWWKGKTPEFVKILNPSSVTVSVAVPDPRSGAGTTFPYGPQQNSSPPLNRGATAESRQQRRQLRANLRPLQADHALVHGITHHRGGLQLIRSCIVPNHHDLHRRQQQPLQRQTIVPAYNPKWLTTPANASSVSSAFSRKSARAVQRFQAEQRRGCRRVPCRRR